VRSPLFQFWIPAPASAGVTTLRRNDNLLFYERVLDGNVTPGSVWRKCSSQLRQCGEGLSTADPTSFHIVDEVTSQASADVHSIAIDGENGLQVFLYLDLCCS